MGSVVVILSGISGSGKTKLAEKLEKDGYRLFDLNVLAEDDPMTLLFKIDEQAKGYEKIVVDGFRTYNSEEILSFTDILTSYNHTAIPVFLYCDKETASQRLIFETETPDCIDLTRGEHVFDKNLNMVDARKTPDIVLRTAKRIIEKHSNYPIVSV